MLLTILHIPQPKENVVHRSALIEKLNERLKQKLIRVSATPVLPGNCFSPLQGMYTDLMDY